WSSDVCSSDLPGAARRGPGDRPGAVHSLEHVAVDVPGQPPDLRLPQGVVRPRARPVRSAPAVVGRGCPVWHPVAHFVPRARPPGQARGLPARSDTLHLAFEGATTPPDGR